MAGASVTLINAEKNFERSQTTNESGGYLFTVVPPGTYRIEVESTGFKKASLSPVNAQVDTPANLDIQLEVGNVSETVSVLVGADAQINTSDASIGTTFESRRISMPGYTRPSRCRGKSRFKLPGPDTLRSGLFTSSFLIISGAETQEPSESYPHKISPSDHNSPIPD